jgi:lysophospholipase L1-like esterase
MPTKLQRVVSWLTNTGRTSASQARNDLGLGSAATLSAGTAGAAVMAADTGSEGRTALGLGTAAVTNTGTSAGNVVVLDGSARLPAVDGRNLTNLPASGGIARVVSANTTAANDERLNVVASATITDPSPVEGKGYSVAVVNGTATVGGTGYSTAGTIIERVFHSGSWQTEVYLDSTQVIPADEKAAENGVATLGSTGRHVAAQVRGFQAETLDYEARVIAAGGRIGAQALEAVDSFIARGKSVGWWSNLRDVFCPLGDYIASQIKVLDGSTGGVGATFYNNSAAYYTEGFGYRLASNANFYVNTNFDISALTASNAMFAFAATDDVVSSSLRLIVGTDVTNTTPVIGLTNHDGRFGISTGPSDAIGRFCSVASAPFVISARWGSQREIIQNGVQASIASGTQANALSGNITLFRNHWTGAGTYFSFGGVGLWAIGTAAASMAIHRDFNLACYELMRATRLRFREPALITFGDSITSGRDQIASSDYRGTFRWGAILARGLGLREINLGVPGSAMNGAGTLPEAVSGVSRQGEIFDLPGNVIGCLYGTNDMTVDADVNGGATPLANLTTNLTTLGTAARNSGRTVIFGGPALRTAGQGATKQEAYQAAVAAAAKATGMPFADLYRLFRDMGDDATIKAAFIPDDVHLNAAGHAIVGAAMLRAARGILYRRPSVDFGSIAAGAVETVDVTVLNAVAGMQVRVTPTSALNTGLVLLPAVITANDTVQLRILNTTGGSIDPAAQYFTIEVSA